MREQLPLTTGMLIRQVVRIRFDEAISVPVLRSQMIGCRFGIGHFHLSER